MSVLIEAEKLRRKLEKLDAKLNESVAALHDKAEKSRSELLNAASPTVIALLQKLDKETAE